MTRYTLYLDGRAAGELRAWSREAALRDSLAVRLARLGRVVAVRGGRATVGEAIEREIERELT